MTEAQWNRNPVCCVCGSRKSWVEIVKVGFKNSHGQKSFVSARSNPIEWGIEVLADIRINTDWPVYRFCSPSCREVFQLNPLAYENSPSYIV